MWVAYISTFIIYYLMNVDNLLINNCHHCCWNVNIFICCYNTPLNWTINKIRINQIVINWNLSICWHAYIGRNSMMVFVGCLPTQWVVWTLYSKSVHTLCCQYDNGMVKFNSQNMIDIHTHTVHISTSSSNYCVWNIYRHFQYFLL